MSTKTLAPRQINAQRKADGKPPLNFRLIRRIIEKIEATPEAYDQGVWGRRAPTAPCGTAACIAGWASFLGGKKSLEQLHRNLKSVRKLAVDLIGLKDTKDYETEIGMFDGYADRWPRPYSNRFQDATTRKQQAKVAVAYLKHVLRTGQMID